MNFLKKLKKQGDLKNILTFSFLLLFSFNQVNAWYKLEAGSLGLVNKYDFSQSNLDKQITRKELVETIYDWYKDYRTDRRLYVDYSNYTELDNSKYFKDVDLNSEFWKKLQYFAHLWAFSKNEYFSPNTWVDQNTFFIILKRLWIIQSLQACVSLRICEKEADNNTYFTTWVYYRYVSKIMDKSLRKYYLKPLDYINVWYKPYLETNYYFPLKWQTLNWCYAFSVRNILKYQYWTWIYIPNVEDYIWKQWEDLWNYYSMNQFDEVVNIKRKHFYSLDTLMNSLQVWEPVAITYKMKYYSYKEKKYKFVSHIVAAYSFDEKWVWVSETVSARRVRIPWEDVFNDWWWVKYNRIFKYYYTPKSQWSESAIVLENKYNFLAWEK